MTWGFTDKVTRTLEDPQLRQLGRLLAICALVGLVAGLGAAAFYVMLDASRAACLGYLANYDPAMPGFEKPLFDFGSWRSGGSIVRWALLLLPAAGGLLSGIIVFTLAPEAEGHGTDSAIEAYHFKDGFIRARVPVVKAITSMLTIGSGGSAGNEGPISQIGSGFGSVLGQWLKVPPHERRLLMAAGMGAGIGAIFHAPLAGAIFAAEVMYRGPDFEHEALVPAFIASIVAYSVYGWIFGFHPMFDTPQYSFHQPASLLAYLILAVIVSLGALLFVKTLYGMRRITFVRLQRWPNHIKPAIGGLLAGIIGFFLPEALGTGYGTVQMCFNSDAGREPALMALPTAQAVVALLGWRISPVALGAGLLAAIGLGKILTTSLTVGSGGSGGAFGPAVVIGAALGGATGLVCMHLFPYLDIQPGAFALVGMAGFFAGAAHTPVSTIIMVSEITGNYDLLVPSMLVCITSFVLCRRFTLYEKQLLSRLEAPTKLGNMASAILRRLTVREALATRRDTPVLVARSTSLSELMKRFAQSTHAAFPVVDEKQQLVGVVDAGDIRRVVTEAGVGDLIIAGDIEKTAVTITPDDSLLSAINSMVQAGSLDLVVVESPGSRQVVGTLNRADIFTAYNRAMIEQTVPIL